MVTLSNSGIPATLSRAVVFVAALSAWLIPANDGVRALEIPAASISKGKNFHQSYGGFDKLVRYVAMGTPRLRLDFAHYSIFQMTLEHEEALAVAVHAPRTSDKKLAKRRRWIAATGEYLATLAATLDAIGLAEDVPVYSSRAGAPTIIVDGHPFLVSSLDATQPERLGTAIVEAFCRLNRCDFLIEPEQAQPAISARQIPTPNLSLAARWSFGDGAYAVLQTGGGLNFMFKNVTDRVRKEQVCVALSKELHSLGDRLGEVALAGYSIDWDKLRLEDQGDYQKLYVDGGESFVRLNLPVLTQAHRVLRIAGPWLQAHVRGEAATQFFPSADLLLEGVVALRAAAPGATTLAITL